MNTTIGIYTTENYSGIIDYLPETINKWQYAWRHLLDIAYKNENIESFVILPGVIRHFTDDNEHFQIMDSYSDHIHFMKTFTSTNIDEIEFDYTWKRYEKKEMPPVNKNLRELIVPQVLFYCLGISSFMKHTFPNCKVKFWEDM